MKGLGQKGQGAEGASQRIDWELQSSRHLTFDLKIWGQVNLPGVHKELDLHKHNNQNQIVNSMPRFLLITRYNNQIQVLCMEWLSLSL